MILHRIRARVRYPAASGLSVWSRDQMAVRHGQAVHIRQGEPADEEPVNLVDGEVFVCDLALADEAAATDAMATLTEASVWSQALPLEDREGPQPAFVEYHLCDHADDARSGCVIVDRVEVLEEAPTEPEPWVQPTGAHDAYPLGAVVTHNGSEWTSTVADNVWEPGVFGWEETP